MDITQLIIRARNLKGVNQAELARRLGVERGNYSRLEKRGNKLSIEFIESIANALDMSLLEILIDEPAHEISFEEVGSKGIDVSEKRIKELEKLLSVYEDNHSRIIINEDAIRFTISYTLDNMLWDIAFKNSIITKEEAINYGLIWAEEIKGWKDEEYWEPLDKSHPYAMEKLPDAKKKKALNILFQLVLVRNIVHFRLCNDDFYNAYKEWLDEDHKGFDRFHRFNVTKPIYHTFQNESPEK